MADRWRLTCSCGLWRGFTETGRAQTRGGAWAREGHARRQGRKPRRLLPPGMAARPQHPRSI